MPLQRAYSYIRFSKGDQAEGNSLERQLDATRTYCEQHNLALDESLNLQDLGVSGFTGKNLRNGALGRFVSAVEDGTIPSGAALVIEDQDRLSRLEPKAVMSLLLRLLDAGIDIHFTATRMVFKADAGGTQQAMDLMMAVSMALKAHQFSAMNSERLSKAFAAKRRRAAAGEKVIVSKSIPWWLVWGPEGTMEAPEDRVAVLKEIFRLTAEGMASAKIARMFNSNPEQYPTFRDGEVWHDNRIRLTVRSNAPLGVLEPTDKTRSRGRNYSIPNYYPAIIDEKLAKLARARITDNLRATRGRESVGTRPVNLFRGLLRLDGLPARCSAHKNGTPDETGAKTWNLYYEAFDDATGKLAAIISGKQIEPVIVAALDEIRPTDLQPLTPVRQLHAPAAKARLEKLRRSQAGLLKVAEAAAGLGEGRIQSIVDQLAKLEEQIRDAESALSHAESLDAAAKRSIRLPKTEITDAKKNLRDNGTRKPFAAALRRIVSRIDVAETPEQLDIGVAATLNFAAKVNSRDVSVLDDPIPATRRRKPLAVLITFTNGAARLIVRLPEERNRHLRDKLLSARIEAKANPARRIVHLTRRTNLLIPTPCRARLNECGGDIAVAAEKSL